MTGDRRLTGTRRHAESGAVAGLEILPLGLLVFVIGTLVVTNAWAVIDTKLAAVAAAREAARTYVEAPSAAVAGPAALRAGADAIAGHGRDPSKLVLRSDGTDLIRCNRVVFTAEYPVPALSLPWGIGFGRGLTVSARHVEIVDPLRSGLRADNSCGY